MIDSSIYIIAIIAIFIFLMIGNIESIIFLLITTLLKLTRILILTILLICVIGFIILILLSLKYGYDIYNTNVIDFIKNYLPFLFPWINEMNWKGLSETLGLFSIIKFIFSIFIGGTIVNLIVGSLLLNMRIDFYGTDEDN